MIYLKVLEGLCHNMQGTATNDIPLYSQEMAWSDIPWSDPRWLDPRPLMYNAAENAEVRGMLIFVYRILTLLIIGVCNEQVEKVSILESCCLFQPPSIPTGIENYYVIFSKRFLFRKLIINPLTLIVYD